MGDEAPGVLFVVSTPIGNLKDVTLRALEVLGSVDLIAAEDTRRTRVLLGEYGIEKPVTSYHDFSEARKALSLVRQIEKGKRVALVSEAGSPGVCDPCYRLVQTALERGTPVVPIPGATALIPALVVSGLPTDRFVFEGFLPSQSPARRKRLRALRSEVRTLIFYEAPHRLVESLEDLAAELGDRDVAVARELTKIYEEVLRGPASRVVERLRAEPPRGEFVVVCRGAGGAPEEDPEAVARVDRHLDYLLSEGGLSAREAVREVVRVHGLPRRFVYGRAIERAERSREQGVRR